MLRIIILIIPFKRDTYQLTSPLMRKTSSCLSTSFRRSVFTALLYNQPPLNLYSASFVSYTANLSVARICHSGVVRGLLILLVSHSCRKESVSNLLHIELSDRKYRASISNDTRNLISPFLSNSLHSAMVAQLLQG